MNICEWCGLPSVERYCKPHLALGLALDGIDKQIANWEGEDFESFDLLVLAREVLYRSLANIEPEVGDEEG